MKFIDLHTHSNMSDGSYRPEEVVTLAKKAGLSAIALTDHDTIGGVEAAAKQAVLVQIDFLQGMEMTVQYKARKLHIVALNFDCTHPDFQQLYKKIRYVKELGVDAAVEKIRAKGIAVDMQMLEAQFTSTDHVDRYAIMRYFVSTKKFKRVQDIWDQYIDPAFEGTDLNITAEEGLAAIKAAGGVTSLAHYHKRLGLGNMTRAAQETAIQELLAMGLHGMEGFYPNYTAEDQKFAQYLIDKYKMIPTGGTDFHGTNRPGVEIGTGIAGNINVPYTWYEMIKNKNFLDRK